MNEKPEPLVIKTGGIETEGSIMGDQQAAPPPIELDEEALLAALYRMERRQSRALKKLHEKADKKAKRIARNSRRRNRS